MRPMGFARGVGGPDGEASVSIEKAENGYLVTLAPQFSFDDLGPMAYPMVRPEPHEIEGIKKSREKSRPRVFIYLSLDDAWSAVKEFLMDGRMPKSS